MGKGGVDLLGLLGDQKKIAEQSQSQAGQVLANEQERNKELKRIADALEKILELLE